MIWTALGLLHVALPVTRAQVPSAAESCRGVDWNALAEQVRAARRAAWIARIRCDPAAVLQAERALSYRLRSACDSLCRRNPAELAPSTAVQFLVGQLLATRDSNTRRWVRQCDVETSRRLDPTGELAFWFALDALEAKERPRAVALLEGEMTGDLRGQADWLLVRALDGVDPRQAGLRAAAIVQAHRAHPYAGLLSLRGARQLIEDGNLDAARSLLTGWLNGGSAEAELRAAAHTLLAEIHRRRGERAAFRENFLAASSVGSGVQEAALRVRHAREILAADSLLETPLIRAALRVLCTSSEPRDALREWRARAAALDADGRRQIADLLLDALSRAREDDALLALAGELRAGRDRASAIRAALCAGRIWRRRGNLDAEVEAFGAAAWRGDSTAVLSSREREDAALALWELGRELEDAGEWERAAQTYRELRMRFPQDANSLEAGVREALDRERQGAHTWARERLAQLCAEAPSRYTATPCLWEALIAPPAQRRSLLERAAREENPGYSAQRARGALRLTAGGEDSLYWTALAREARDPASWPWPPRTVRDSTAATVLAARIEAWPGVDTGLLLLRYGHPLWGRALWSRGEGWGALDPLERAAVARALGDTEGAVRAAIASGDPHGRYPVAFAEEIAEAAERFRLSPALLLAVIRQESLFALTALSTAGARGLMQLMPATARRMADSLGWRSFDADLPRDNILLGAAHLAELLAASGGEVPVALAAYNAGPERAQAWRPRGRTLDEYVERIGYSETRRFVRSVLMHYGFYRELYPVAPAAPCGSD